MSETEVLIKAASENRGSGSSEPIIPERLPFPVARLQSQPLPKGTIQAGSNPKPKPPRFLWRDDADDDEDDDTVEVKPMEVQRMVITTPTPDWLMPQPYPEEGASTSTPTPAVPAAPSTIEAIPATETPATVATPTVTTNEAPVSARSSQATEASQAAEASRIAQASEPAPEAQESHETTPTQPTPTATIPTPTLTPTIVTQAAGSMDVSTLLGPDISISSSSKDSTQQRSSVISNDSSSTLAPPTPGSDKHSRSGSDVSQEQEDESDEDPAADYADTEDEADVPFPLFLVRDGLPDSILGATIADEDDLAWADVPPPAALSEMVALPDGAEIPELLREVLSSCIESVQAQLAVAVSEKAERDKVRAAEAEAAAAARAEEKRKRREELERKRKEEASLSKGKGKDTETRHIPDPVDLRVPVALPNAAAPVKKSRRQMFASRVMRHVHVLSGSSDKAESSAAGAAAAAEAAQAAAARAALQKALEQEKLRAHNLAYNKAWERQTLSVATGEGSNSSSSQPAVPGKPVKSLAGKLAKGSTTEQWPFTNTPATTTDTTTTTQPRETRAFQMLAKVNRETRAKNGTLLPATIECISCFEDIPRKEAVQTVCHAYCIECFQQLVTTALANEAQFPPKCCLNEVPAATVTKYASRDVAKQYKDKIDEFAIPVGDRVYCPTVDCGVFVPPAHIAKAARIARCRNGHETCTACRQAAHGHGSANREACPEASAQDQRDQRMADELAAEEGWRRCIRCAILIEHREACQHMTCRCGAEFCYVCGLAWRTCGCGMDDLNRIKREADARRAQRSAREARERERIRRQAEQADAELAELRDALAQVAAFEERERRKMRKIQLAQRERLQKLQAQREAELKAEAAVKYDALRVTLATLRDLQAKAAQEARRKERAEHRLQQAKEAAEADERLAKRRAETAEATAAKIREAEQHWTKDYVVRLAMEMRLENEYRQELEAFGEWRGREDQPALVDKSLRAYQRVNDAALDTYTQWKDRTLAETKFMAEEEKAVRDEVQDALRQKHTVASRKDRRALQRKHAGERVWCRAVAAEQARLLDEMQYWENTLGLAGSSNDTDLSLLSLLSQMDKLTGEGEGDEGGERSEGQNGESQNDESEMSQLYSVLVAELAGDDADFLDLDDSDDEDDVYYDVQSGGGSSSNANNAHANTNNNGAGSSRGNEYNWPFVANEAVRNS